MPTNKKNSKRILFVGGGSGGPVAPLLAVAEEIKTLEPDAKFLLIGTRKGPEQAMAAKAKVPYVSVAAGKLRRYVSIKNLLSPFQVALGFIQALFIIKKFKPSVAFGAGSFVQVPVLYAARLLHIPIVIHQQDIVPSFANTLCAPIAEKITLSFEVSGKTFMQGSGLLSNHKTQKTVYTGNAFRENLKEADKEDALAFFHLMPEWPTLLVLGGGTGAKFINRAVEENLHELTRVAQIVHITGRGKMVEKKHPNYHAYEFTDRMDLAYAAADIVISRAGLSTITELANLGKVSIIVPMPKTHQEYNAEVLWQTKSAIVIDQENFDFSKLPSLIKKLLFKAELQKDLVTNIKKLMPKEASKKIAEIILKEAK